MLPRPRATSHARHRHTRALTPPALTPPAHAQVVQESDVVFIAVKPQYVSVVLKEVGPALTADTLIVSIAAGITVDSLKVRQAAVLLPL